MRGPAPDGIDDALVTSAVADGWNLEIETIEYLPVGAGGYHWRAANGSGQRWFVTVDDLDTKDWFGEDRDTVAIGLGASLRTAQWLHDDVGLDVVVAPLAGTEGRPLRRLNSQFTVSVSPFLDGVTQPFGPHDDPVRRRKVLDALIALHVVAPPPFAPNYVRPRVGQRAHLDAFLADPHQPWTAGPLGEQARTQLVAHVGEISTALQALDRASTEMESAHGVITHGEPHGANVMAVGDQELLIDWDTVGVAVPERDLWFAIADDDDVEYYAAATGHRPNRDALELYRTRWRFDDLCWVVKTLREPHSGDDESQTWLAVVASLLDALLNG